MDRLSKLAQDWNQLGADVTHQLLAAVERKADVMNPQEVSNTIYGLGKLSVSWKMRSGLGDAVERAIVSTVLSMTEQGVSNTLYGLALSGVQWADLKTSTRAAVEAALCGKANPNAYVTPFGTTKTLYGLALLGANKCNLSRTCVSRLETTVASLLHRMNEQGTASTLLS